MRSNGVNIVQTQLVLAEIGISKALPELIVYHVSLKFCSFNRLYSSMHEVGSPINDLSIFSGSKSHLTTRT
jgi:hypothetical protein